MMKVLTLSGGDASVGMGIVLYEPEIPQNTGNIARTCAATGAELHLVGPMGFSISDRYLKRAGLDYWSQVDVMYHENWDAYLHVFPDTPRYFATTKAEFLYAEQQYPEDCHLVFGPETRGLPESLIRDNREKCIRIPMKNSIRSLNLSNSVAIVLFEALRQQGFSRLEKQGAFFRVPGSGK